MNKLNYILGVVLIALNGLSIDVSVNQTLPSVTINYVTNTIPIQTIRIPYLTIANSTNGFNISVYYAWIDTNNIVRKNGSIVLTSDEISQTVIDKSRFNDLYNNLNNIIPINGWMNLNLDNNSNNVKIVWFDNPSKLCSITTNLPPQIDQVFLKQIIQTLTFKIVNPTSFSTKRPYK
jgi:hypothetical protein